MRVTDLAEAIAPDATRKIIGIRPGEKVHEVLITADESRHAVGFDEYFVIQPSFAFWEDSPRRNGDELPPGFRYSSDTNDTWLTPSEIQAMVASPVAPGERPR